MAGVGLVWGVDRWVSGGCAIVGVLRVASKSGRLTVED